jgi:hypothetical protein
MPGIEERERQFQMAINRWENEGGATATNTWTRSRIVDRSEGVPDATSQTKPATEASAQCNDLTSA